MRLDRVELLCGTKVLAHHRGKFYDVDGELLVGGWSWRAMNLPMNGWSEYLSVERRTAGHPHVTFLLGFPR